MKTDVLVSIIMPVYKSEEFIRNSVLSIMNQTYSDIELICINDGTPDNAFEICKELSAEYSNIKLYENEKNMGQEFTRNRGMEKAEGKYMLFFDSDDILAPETIENLVTVAENENENIVLFSYSRIINGKDNPVLLNGVPEGKLTTEQFVDMIFTKLEIGDLSCIGTKMYRTEFVRANDIWFDKKYKYNEDGAFFLHALLATENIYVINQPYYKYIIRTSDSTMSSYRPKMFTSVVNTRELIKKLFQIYGEWNDENRKVAYYQELLALMLNSLINEVKFGNSKTFREACEAVRDYPEFDEMLSCLYKSGKLSKIRKIILPMIKKKLWGAVRLLVKLQTMK